MELKVEKKEDKKLEEFVEQNGGASEEKIESSLNYDNLSKEEKEAIDKFNKEIDVNDQTQILQFGSAAQEKVSKFSDSVLEKVRNKDTGEVGEELSKLVAEIKSFDNAVDASQKSNLFTKLFSSAKKEIDKLIAKYNKVENNINTIEKGLENDKLLMLKDINIYDTMYQKNLEYFKEISLYIIAGEKKKEELNEELEKLREKAQKSQEQLDAQKVQDMENIINRFEKKLYDLKTTRVISLQMAPQIRLLQNNEAELVEKIQSSITNTIPLWKNQMVLALGINNAKTALKHQQEVSKITNEMLVKNSETLKQGSISIAEESEKAIVDVETLKKTNQNIIETLDKVIEIHKQGRIKREESEKELANIEKELKDKMLEIKISKKDEF
ncbi:MAG: toxic anion resistance protein [Bacilli bacterium]|nr:toxic anion resistance protein [Bacilli bacterium]